MTRKIDDIIFIEKEPNGQCDYCGKIAELRPYGENGECICFECGMENEGTTKKIFNKILGE